MRFRVFGAGILCGVVVAAGAASGSSQGPPTGASVGAAIDAIWAKYSKQLLGMCAGVVAGRIDRVNCYGKKAPGSNVTPDVNTLFEIDSVTKSFTAALLALRLQQHRIKSVTEPVRDYLTAGSGRLQMPKTVTFLDLADHYAGLPRDVPSTFATADDLIRAASTCIADATCRTSKPEHRFNYSNWGVAALGDLLALTDGYTDGPIGPWALDNANIVQPLGLLHTRTWKDWTTNPSASVYFTNHHATSDTGEQHFGSEPEGDPAGALYSTPHDMLRWLVYSMGLGRKLRPQPDHDLLDAWHWLYKDPPLRTTSGPGHQIGLVWNIDSTTGTNCVSKAGDGLGFHAYVIFVEGQTRGVFLLVNNTPRTSYRTIATELLNNLPRTPGHGTPTC